MAGHVRYTALLDACVLYPVLIADCLMSLVEVRLYAAKWTTVIEEEWIRSLERDKPHLAGKLGNRRDAMRKAVPDWEVKASAWQALSPSIELPDKNDAHVVAAAIAGHADCIVTANLRHFPIEILDTYDLEAIHPDQFIAAQFDLDNIAALTAMKEMRSRWKNPPLSAVSFVESFENHRLFSTAEILRQAVNLI